MEGNPTFVQTALSHVFWRKKEQFELAVDTYDHWVLFAVTEGSFRYEIEDKSGEAAYGDLVFCPPGAAFHREVLQTVSFHFYSFEWVPDNGAACDRLTHKSRPVGAITLYDRSRLSSTYYYLQQLSRLDEERRLLSIQALFRDIWHQFCMQTMLVLTEQQHPLDAEMREAALWMEQHAFTPLRLREFAESRRISAVQFTRRFQQAWGQTPMDYLTGLRIERAKMLLLETLLPLDDIAQQCGYENGFYLSRVFTKKMKVAPSVFRRVNRL
ncbi:helix-turn-helix domain-containing protein [Paenibacillus sp. GCM10023252]|uniref:helix-turn-helix domain-containing protein n=1 Tax=Paenibacillus sp. GCM10023252 TaxID=3252649 RepID=UPI003606DFFA